MKKNIFIFLLIIIILLFVGLFLLSIFNNKDISNEVLIIQYELGGDEIIKEVTVNDEKEVKELSEYVEELKPLTDDEMVNLALLNEIEIIYNNSISIGVELAEDGYCYYINRDENITSLSKMPKGLIDWINDNLMLR